MAELTFPANPNIKPEYTSDSGITYYWDDTSSSWVMLSSQSVNRNYVDSRDQLRYRRDGADFIFGDVIIKETNDLTSLTTTKITTDGKLTLAKDANILFSSDGGDGEGGSISFGNTSAEQELLNFSAEFVKVRKPFRFDTTDTRKINRIEVNGHPEVFLFDIAQISTASIPSDYIIRMPKSDKSSFVVKGQDSKSHLRVKGDGQVVVSHQSEKGFVVKSEATDYVFRVDPNTHKIYASYEYSKALLTGGGQVTDGNGNKIFSQLEEGNLIVTKNYVDALNKDNRGSNMTADREADAESGGFWRLGSNLFWKI